MDNNVEKDNAVEPKDQNIDKSQQPVNEEKAVVKEETNNTQTGNTGDNLEELKKKDVLSLINPQEKTEEFHLINKKDLPKKKNRYEGYEYKPPSKLKIFLLVIFLIFIGAVVMFMPEIYSYVQIYIFSQTPEESTDITTGNLICKQTQNSTVFTYTRKAVFAYTDNKLDLLTFTITTKGSATEDSAAINDVYEKCKVLSTHAEEISGLSVRCDLKTDSVIEEEVIDYNKYNREQMISAFVEAGGTYPDYDLGDDIDAIQKEMLASNYDCEKAK